MTNIKCAFVHFTLSEHMLDDKHARDEAVFRACKELAIGLLNMGLQPFGEPKLRWLNPEEDRYYTGWITGRLMQKGVALVPVRPEEWDVQW
jgi:hypothetical protein